MDEALKKWFSNGKIELLKSKQLNGHTLYHGKAPRLEICLVCPDIDDLESLMSQWWELVRWRRRSQDRWLAIRCDFNDFSTYLVLKGHDQVITV